VKVGVLKRTLPSGRSTLNVKLKSKARKAIKKAGKVKLRVAVVITDRRREPRQPSGDGEAQAMTATPP